MMNNLVAVPEMTKQMIDYDSNGTDYCITSSMTYMTTFQVTFIHTMLGPGSGWRTGSGQGNPLTASETKTSPAQADAFLVSFDELEGGHLQQPGRSTSVAAASVIYWDTLPQKQHQH